jgi:hypothetical protein
MPVNHVIDMMRVHCMLLKVLRQSLTGTGYLTASAGINCFIILKLDAKTI